MQHECVNICIDINIYYTTFILLCNQYDIGIIDNDLFSLFTTNFDNY